MHKLKYNRILLVDDDPEVLEMLKDTFSRYYECLLADSGQKAVEIVSKDDGIGAVVMDIKMNDMDGITAARKIKKISSAIPIIFHTGYPGDYDEDEIDEKERPFDYVLKGDAMSRIIRSVRNAVELRNLKSDHISLADYAETAYHMIGRSKAMQEVYQLIKKVTFSESKVMVQGETGTGKELVARAIHYNSSRRDRRFEVLDCDPNSSDLIESQLFGHMKGAFTGAVSDVAGFFELANGGTVFLDEIGDLNAMTQVKILRVLETGEFHRLGSSDKLVTNVRIISATHKNLESMVEKGQFRRDLYFRLKGVIICLPPLRERREDIPLLIEKFKNKYIQEKRLSYKLFDSSAIRLLVEYDWPGNVRQLLDTVESLIVVSESDIILPEDVEAQLNLEDSWEDDSDDGLTSRVRNFERNTILDALRKTNYNIAAAARILKIDRANLRKKIIYNKIDIHAYRKRQ